MVILIRVGHSIFTVRLLKSSLNNCYEIIKGGKTVRLLIIANYRVMVAV
jgi:hypothetical protein